MRKRIKKLVSFVLAASLLVASASSLGSVSSVQAANEDSGETTSTNQQPFTILTGEELTKDMGAGWNLGNTMDGHTGFTPNETVWQNVKTTKKLIKSVHDMGFNTVRIPVTWGTMIDDDNDYKIDETWMSRVQDIVDYCVSQDMYAIINIHHDGAEQTGWLRIASEDQEGLANKFAGVWKNIATTFKDYDEHLIFESMNEVQGSNMTVVEENQVIMKLNQIFVDTVRATGSNNEERWLMVPGKYNYIDSVCNTKNEFSLPQDTVDNRLIVSVHIYTPSSFCNSEVTTASSTTYSVKQLQMNDEEVKPLYDTYTSKGIPVVVGEYGCINKDNPTERAFYLEGMNRIFKKYKCVGVYWDQGWYDRSQTPDFSFSIIDRETGEPIEKEVTDGLMRGAFGLDGADDYSTLTKSPEVIKVTKLTPSVTELSMNLGEISTITTSYAPENSNDVVLWKTSNPSVATVSYGKVRAKGIGQATITAYTQSGSTSVEIPVIVKSTGTKISVSNETYELEVDDVDYLSAQLNDAAEGETLYFYSENEDVVTISPIGKIVAVGVGSTAIWVCSSSGYRKEVLVNVSSKPVKKEIKLAINVYYNDSAKGYWGNEISEDVLTVTEDGQYQLTFDCTRDLSSSATAKGVTGLSNLTSIYIKDYDVAKGTLSKSIVKQCNIRYDEISVDGQALTITNSAFKSALKASGILDTNDPINSWDGSAVSEVKCSNYIANFTTATEPKSITIKFTLSGLEFEEDGGATPTPSPSTPSTSSPSPGSTSSVNSTPGTPTPVPSPATSTVKKGTTCTIGTGKYKVTKVAGSSKGTVTYMAPKNKKATALTIPATVKYSGKTYKVTQIAKSAFAKCTKLKRVTIGTNIKKIGSKAFYQCKNLKRITIKTKNLSTVGKKAIFGINKKAVIKVPKAKKKKYRKLLSKKGLTKNMKIKA